MYLITKFKRNKMGRFLQQDMDSGTIITVINLDQWIWLIQTESSKLRLSSTKVKNLNRSAAF